MTKPTVKFNRSKESGNIFAILSKVREELRKQRRISARISKIQKYYRRPTELFARFIEGLYVDKEKTKLIAPKTYERFYYLLNLGYYKELKNAIDRVIVWNFV